MNNYMREIANLFGVKIDEEFEIKFKPPSSCKATAVFTESGFNIIHTDAVILTPYWKEQLLYSLLKGDASIEHKPWKPKFNEKYYSIGVDGSTEDGTWLNDFLDYTLYKIGNCYRTVEEARANRNKWGKFYDSDEVLKV